MLSPPITLVIARYTLSSFPLPIVIASQRHSNLSGGGVFLIDCEELCDEAIYHANHWHHELRKFYFRSNDRSGTAYNDMKNYLRHHHLFEREHYRKVFGEVDNATRIPIGVQSLPI